MGIWLLLGGLLAAGLAVLIWQARAAGRLKAVSKGQKGLLQNVAKAKKATQKLRDPAERKRVRRKFTR